MKATGQGTVMNPFSGGEDSSSCSTVEIFFLIFSHYMSCSLQTPVHATLATAWGTLFLLYDLQLSGWVYFLNGT